MSIGIYKITNILNGKIYIGQSVDIEKRWSTHRAELKNNYHYKHVYNFLYFSQQKNRL